MTGATLRITVDDAEVQAALDRLVAAGGTLAPAMKNLGEALMESTQERFRQMQGPDGQPWAPLSPAYARTKRHPERILRLHDHLMDSIHYEPAGPPLSRHQHPRSRENS